MKLLFTWCRFGKKTEKHKAIQLRIFLLSILLISSKAFSQELLVNGNFEEENLCSEFKVKCAPEGWIYTVPSFNYYMKDAQQAHSGSFYVAIIAGHKHRTMYRTFVRTRLLCRLQKDKMYKLKLFVQSQHPVLDSIGVYFSSYDFLFEKQPYYKIKPSAYLRDGIKKPVAGNNTWQEVEINYKATGQEAFMTLGNFSKKDVTGATGFANENNFYIFFDEVSLKPLDINERLCADWAKTRDAIYAQDERHEHLTRWINQYKQNPPPVELATSTKVIKIDTFIVPDVLFATNHYLLNQHSIAVLDSFIRHINELQLDSIVIHGHTDSRGNEIFNQELSWKRAASVTAYIKKKVPASYYTLGWGSRKPIADNRSVVGRQRNRRVEIYLYLRD